MDTTTILLILVVAIVVIVAVVILRSRGRTTVDPVIETRPDSADAIASPPSAVPVAPEPRPIADEPIAAAAPLDATPASIAAEAPEAAPAPPAPTVPPAHGAAALTQLKGLGPKLATTLAGLGFTRIDQIAALTAGDAEALDAQLGAFKGRMLRDRWIEQAKLLSAGDTAGYEAAFGKLGG